MKKLIRNDRLISRLFLCRAYQYSGGCQWGPVSKRGLILPYSPSFTEPAKETFYMQKEETFTYLYNTVGRCRSHRSCFLSAAYPLKQSSTFIES
ncbi:MULTISPECIES: hypothetical protein [unclassified Sporosarcina]|uniref:hypothetical protein n=1 Tax=unclassified Sporosarcina TaxID=2647733 RepID=UPI00203F2387|nr:MULTISPECIES: hypothetical protein [unclassified Sporosarcina]